MPYFQTRWPSMHGSSAGESVALTTTSRSNMTLRLAPLIGLEQ
jgi:hypothetical protein